MRLKIEDLPDPESDYDIEEDRKYNILNNTDEDLPKITIVTPSFNQGKFIEYTIRCILLQGYSNIEYIIIDGGSTDGTVNIIKKYEQWIKYWVSEKDTGMYEAINKGFKRGTGEIMAWSPTGDLYVPGAFYKIGNIFKKNKDINWITSAYKIKIDESGKEIDRYTVEGFNRNMFFKGINNITGSKNARYMIQQQSTFWRSCLWETAGGRVDQTMKGAGDFELWSRFYKNDTLYTADFPIGIFRIHDGQESKKNIERMKRESEQAFKQSGGKKMTIFEGFMRKKILRKKLFKTLVEKINVQNIVNILIWREEENNIIIKDKYIV